MEVWEIASALGDATVAVEEWSAEYSRLEHEAEKESDSPTFAAPNVNYGQDLLAQRVAASKGEAPSPEARTMGQIETANLMRTLSGD
jgi:hypothetical protein